MLKKVISVMLTMCILFSCFAIGTFTQAIAADADYGLVDNIQNGQILQCWNWSYNNIKKNMELIAEQGFSAIQTSPIQATKETTKAYYSTMSNSWWVYYQPISFSIETNSYNALGTKTEFKAMCAEAHKYGVKVVVDAVLNHLANASANTVHSSVSSDIKDDSSCWHSPMSYNISNYSNRYDVTHYCLDGLPDLNTGSSKIQTYAANFLKECIDCGADGFRFDAARHIETPGDASGTSSDFWPNVLNAATSYAQSTRGITPYYYGEILDSLSGLDAKCYTTYMSITDNNSSNNIRNNVVSGNAQGAANSYINFGSAPNKTVQWNESHDTYASGGSSNVSNSNINKTWAIVGSRAETCGMYLARPASNSDMLGTAGITAWANPEVEAINKFKNSFVGHNEYMASSGSIAYVERGSSGVVLVNVGGNSTKVSVPAHIIANGTYSDAITGNTFTVSNGTISGQIGSTGIAVVYNCDSTDIVIPSSSAQSTTASTQAEKVSVSLAGSFNDWSTIKNPMTATTGNVVSTTLTLDAGTYEFKIVEGSDWFGLEDTVNDSTDNGSTGWTLYNNTSNIKLNASGGTYTFNYNTYTNALVVEYTPSETEATESTETSSTSSAITYLAGEFNDWDTKATPMYTTSDNVVSTTLTLDEGSYKFKIVENGNWYGNNGTIEDTTTATSAIGWRMETSAGNCTLEASGGTYTFQYNTSTKMLFVLYSAVVETDPTDVPTEEPTEKPTEKPTEVDSTKVSVFGDINLDLALEEGTKYVGTIDLDAGVYTFKIREFGVEMGGNYAYTDEMRSVTYNAAWGAVTTFTVSGGRYTFNFNTSTNRLDIRCKPYSDLVEVYGDINIELVRKGTGSLFTGSARVEAGSYNFKINDMGTHMGFGYEFDDVVYNVEYRAEWSGETTFKASGGLYTFKYDVDTNKLTVQRAPSGAGDVRIFGDIDLNLIKDYGTVYSVTTTLQAGTYQFRVDNFGTTLCNGSTFTESIYKIEYKADWKSATTFNVEDGKYTFRFDTATNRLTVLYAPLEDKISIFGDIELELTKSSDGVTYAGSVDLEAGTYAFRVDKRGIIYCLGGTFTDGLNKVYSTDFNASTTFIATGGTYRFQFNSDTNKLFVRKTA